MCQESKQRSVFHEVMNATMTLWAQVLLYVPPSDQDVFRDQLERIEEAVKGCNRAHFEEGK